MSKEEIKRHRLDNLLHQIRELDNKIHKLECEIDTIVLVGEKYESIIDKHCYNMKLGLLRSELKYVKDYMIMKIEEKRALYDTLDK